MDELRILLQENLNTEFISAVLSNPRKKDGTEKIKVRPLLKKGELLFQVESFRGKQAFHENLPAAGACRALLGHMETCGRCRWRRRKAGTRCWSARREK